MRNTLLRSAGAALATAVGITSAVAVAGPASADPPTRLSGVVTTATNAPLSNVKVTALSKSTVDGVDKWTVAGSAVTGTDGSYSMMRIEDGTYRIRFDDQAGTYATEFYNNKSLIEDADEVKIAPGQKTNLGTTDLGAAAHLTGFVTGSTGTGIPNAQVTAYVKKNGSWSELLTADTQSDGRYDLGLLPGGTYTLGFHDPATNVGEYWNDKADLSAADTLTLAQAGITTGLNAQLATPLPTPTENPSPTPTTSPTTTTPTGTLPGTVTPATTATKAVTVAVRPRIKGVAKVAKVLKVTKGTWTPTTVTKKIQWLANGKRIKGATKNKLRLTKKLAGKRISVRVIASAPGLTPLKITTKRTKQVRR